MKEGKTNNPNAPGTFPTAKNETKSSSLTREETLRHCRRVHFIFARLKHELSLPVTDQLESERIGSNASANQFLPHDMVSAPVFVKRDAVDSLVLSTLVEVHATSPAISNHSTSRLNCGNAILRYSTVDQLVGEYKWVGTVGKDDLEMNFGGCVSIKGRLTTARPSSIRIHGTGLS